VIPQLGLFAPPVDAFRKAAMDFIRCRVLRGEDPITGISGCGGPGLMSCQIGGYVHDPANGDFDFATTKFRKVKPGEIAVGDEIRLEVFNLEELAREIRSEVQA
jgi:hypothetical protein